MFNFFVYFIFKYRCIYQNKKISTIVHYNNMKIVAILINNLNVDINELFFVNLSTFITMKSMFDTKRKCLKLSKLKLFLYNCFT